MKNFILPAFKAVLFARAQLEMIVGGAEVTPLGKAAMNFLSFFQFLQVIKTGN